MQDIDTASCAATPTGDEAQLEDKRDGKKYWIGKMKDDRCWMLQNLALDLTTAGLKSSDTNISSNWASGSTYPPNATVTGVTGGSAVSTAVQSWNLGKWVLATPLLTAGCGNTTAGQSISNCTKAGFVDVSSSSFQPTYTAATRSWDGANADSSTLVAVNCTSWSGSGTSKKCTAGTYDAHFLVGNYYSWNAATAGTGGTIKNADASGSICPKGWELPYVIPSGGAIPFGAKEFGDLLAAYGVESSLSGTVNGTSYNIAGPPLRFVRSGYVVVGDNYINNAAKGGHYWTSTAYSNTANAYRLYFHATSVDPSAIYYRQYGFSVRCVAE